MTNIPVHIMCIFTPMNVLVHTYAHTHTHQRNVLLIDNRKYNIDDWLSLLLSFSKLIEFVFIYIVYVTYLQNRKSENQRDREDKQKVEVNK